MKEVLSQDEINALSRVASEGGFTSKVATKGRNYSPFVFGKASRISKQQVRDIAQVHESFTYNLKNRLSASLQTTTEVVPASVDEMPYSDFTQNVSSGTYLASLNVRPAHSLAILSLDLAVALSIINLMLGGDGKSGAAERPVTEIEESILQIVMDTICEELQAVWRQVVEVEFSFEKTRRSADMYRLMPAYERILVLDFEVRTVGVSGMLTLAFPASASSLLVRRLSKRNLRASTQSPESQNRLRERLGESIFAIEMVLPPTRIRGKDLLSLAVGQTVLIQHPLNQAAIINVARRKMFSAYPVRNGTRRGAAVSEVFPISFSFEKVNE